MKIIRFLTNVSPFESRTLTWLEGRSPVTNAMSYLCNSWHRWKRIQNGCHSTMLSCAEEIEIKRCNYAKLNHNYIIIFIISYDALICQLEGKQFIAEFSVIKSKLNFHKCNLKCFSWTHFVEIKMISYLRWPNIICKIDFMMMYSWYQSTMFVNSKV